MKRHSISPSNNTEQTEAPTLPDRSDLSKLYFQPKPATITENVKASILDPEYLANTIRQYAVKIGLLVPLPFIVAMIPAALFIVYVSPSNIFQMLPLMTLTMIAWGIAVVLMFSKVIGYLNRLSIPTFIFLSLLLSCLLLLSQPIYHLAHSIGNFWAGQALFSVAMITVSLGLCWIFLQLILNDRLADSTRVRLIGMVVFLCLMSTVFYLVTTH